MITILPYIVMSLTTGCISKTNPSTACCSGDIELDTSMISIASLAFYGCTGLTGNIVIPNNIISIGSSAFAGGLSGLTGTLTLPNNLTSIGTEAFKQSAFTGLLTIPGNTK